MVLELVPQSLAQEISNRLSIPTIGIGAGPQCDGQVLVLQDMIGIYPKKSPKFSKNFLDGADSIQSAIANYVRDVKQGQFPGPEHSFT